MTRVWKLHAWCIAARIAMKVTINLENIVRNKDLER